MAKLFLLVALFAGVHSDHYQDTSPIKRVTCTLQFHNQREEYLEKASCGSPRLVYVRMKVPTSASWMVPDGVWARRCVGSCGHSRPGHFCAGTNIIITPIPVVIHSSTTHNEYCGTYMLEEHENCGCCIMMTQEECAAALNYNSTLYIDDENY